MIHTYTAETPYNPDSNFTMRALTLVEAAGVPVMRNIETHSRHIRDTVGFKVSEHRVSDPKTDPFLLRLTSLTHVSSECLSVFTDWLTRGGKLPPTWRSLLHVIRQLGLDDLANQVETYLKTGRVDHQEGTTTHVLQGAIYKVCMYIADSIF